MPNNANRLLGIYLLNQAPQPFTNIYAPDWQEPLDAEHPVCGTLAFISENSKSTHEQNNHLTSYHPFVNQL